MQFYELAVGSVFQFHGQRYKKIAMSMAIDVKRNGHVFMAETVVVPEGTPQLLPPEEAARWRPSGRYWADYITPAPGQVDS